MAVHQRPAVVISPSFLVEYTMNLAVATQFRTFKNDFLVKDVNGTIIFTTKSKQISLRNRRKLLDSAGNVLVSMRHKLMTAHGRWVAYKGDSMDENDGDLLFTVRKSSLVQTSTILDVFLAGNKEEAVADFKIRGGSSDGSFDIYLGNTNKIVAQISRDGRSRSSRRVIIYPNVDYAFIVSLVVILEKMNEDGSIEEVMSSPEVEAGLQGPSLLSSEILEDDEGDYY